MDGCVVEEGMRGQAGTHTDRTHTLSHTHTHSHTPLYCRRTWPVVHGWLADDLCGVGRVLRCRVGCLYDMIVELERGRDHTPPTVVL